MSEPQFSVIIPAFNVQGYLRQAVMSVAGADRTEVIVVDDCSTDDTARLADELAALHSSVRVVRPESNAGLGRARNLGMSHASGEYILFLDGDDYFAPGALEEIRDAVTAQSPDIVQFGYARLYANGDVHEGVKREPLQAPGPFVASERLSIYSVLNVAWNKAYRRKFLEQAGLEFPEGYYEDIPWTYPLLALAESIVGIDRPLYLYRQRSSGSILRSTDRRHLQILDQFMRLMAVLDERAIDGPDRRAIFDSAFRNLATLLTDQRGRLPAGERRQFYRDVQRALRSHAPAEYAPPTTGDKVKAMAWIWREPYPAFESHVLLRDAYRQGRSRGRSAAGLAKRTARWAYHHPRLYQVLRRSARLDPDLVVLEALWGRSPRLNCLAVANEITASHPEKKIVWLVQPADASLVPDGVDYAVQGSHKYFRSLATATYLFVDANLPSWWRKRRGQVLTQLHHGTPLKLMGMEERGKDREWRNRLLARCSQWDYSVVSNSYTAEVWKHSYPVRCETLEVGYPRNDALVSPDGTVGARVREQLGIPAKSRVFLYMPTFRDGGAGVSTGVDIRELAAAIPEDVVVLVRGHYFYAAQTSLPSQSRVIDVSSYPEVEELYLAADVLVTDYSSAMFDFANLRRPIIIFPYDWDLYQSTRGTYFDVTADAPGAVVWSTEELAAVITDKSYDSDENRERIERFAAIFTEFETGTAARDVVARVIDGVASPRAASRPIPALTSWWTDRVA
ncbi:bifunctional glycosyltransferase family 2 protein/CDP-glycerol:glycerophosphate glycerophosphotransferase [uncultured Demequina sp.]|uniref:bifunctional glycosyltransferase/CDP-glycerol:glycerophosphate glycerophosphotransferase n=1 Tax=uncultured Demequina sp. TaxID=693499 RepID=UPI0025E1A969|nr:bifunctional glycosyltransferase family 2 protein/CDP-glycerol:glycerophosphate glycerophosphotransferase [uncultured Demequina sp.]